MVSVLLSAGLERVGASCMQDFFLQIYVYIYIFFYKVVKLVDGGSVIIEAYLV